MHLHLLSIALCAGMQLNAMESSKDEAHQLALHKTEQRDQGTIMHDFLHNHAKFKALWGTAEKNGTTYLRLPKEIAQRIAHEALIPALPMLKKSPSILQTGKKVSKTFFDEPKSYASKNAWNYFAVNTSDENICPTPAEAHPKNKLAFSALPSGSVKIWNMKTSSCLNTLVGHTEPVRYAQFDPSGNLLATSSEDLRVKIWDVHSGECLLTLHEYWFKVPLIRFNKNGTLLAIAESNVINFFNLATWEYVHHIVGSQNFHNFTFNDDETCLIGLHQTEKDGFYTRIWDIKNKKWIKQIEPSYCEEMSGSKNMLLLKGSHKKHVMFVDCGSYFAAINFFDHVTLEQAMLLNCIAHTMLINKSLREKYSLKNSEFLEKIMRQFDFNKFPHLQQYFESLPKEIQHGLSEYVILRDDEDSWCTIV